MRKPFLLFLSITLLFGQLHATNKEWVAYSQLVFSLVLLLLILIIGFFALRWTYRNKYQGEDGFLKYTLNNALVKLSFLTVFLILICSYLIPETELESPQQKIQYAKLRSLPKYAASAYKTMLKESPYVPAYHYEFVISTYKVDTWSKGSNDIQVTLPEGSHPYGYYSKLFASNDPALHDLAFLGMGMCEYFEGLTKQAFGKFNDVSDQNLPFLNFFLGRVASRRHDSRTAIYHYKREMDLHGMEGLVIPYLTSEYYQLDYLDGIQSLLDDPELSSSVPIMYQRYLYTRTARLGPYFSAVLSAWLNQVSLIGSLGALAGLIVWIFFLRKIAIFRKRKLGPMLGMVALGAFCSIGCMPFYDFLHFEMGLDINGNAVNDLLYSIAGIGLIEEFVKIVPFLLILKLTKLIRGPLDYIIYASLCALGFAFVENLIYFDNSSISIIHGRVLITSVGHMFASSTIAFGLIIGKYRYGKHKTFFFALFFLLAIIFHGIYDFWLLSSSVSPLFFLAYLIFIYSTFQYASYINNCLNNSLMYKGRTILDTPKLASFLLIALVLVLLFEYVALSAIYGSEIGNEALFHSLGMGSFLMFFVVLNLSYIDVVQGEWFIVRFWNFGSRQNFNKAIGQRLTLSEAKPGSVMSSILPLKGEVIARIKLQNDNRYFLFEFDEPATFAKHEVSHVLIKTKDRNLVIGPGYNMEAAIIIFRDKKALLKPKKERKDFKLLDYVIVN